MMRACSDKSGLQVGASTKLISLYLFVYAFAIAYFIGKNHINYLVVGWAGVFSLVFLMNIFVVKRYELFAFVFLMVTLFSVVYNDAAFRMSTVIYMVSVLFSFMFVVRVLYKYGYPVCVYIRVLRNIIVFFFVVLVIQQIQVAMGVSVLNKIAGVGFKLNSLSTEPAISAIVLSFSFYSLIWVLSKQTHLPASVLIFGNERVAFFMYTYCVATMLSTLGIVLYVLFILYLLANNNRSVAIYPLLLLVMLGLLSIMPFNPTVRLVRFVEAIPSFDISAYISADHSAAVRVAPLLTYLTNLDFFDVSFWVGKGIDANVETFGGLPGVERGVGLGGMIPSHLNNYGVLSFVAFLLLVRRICFDGYFGFQPILVYVLFLTISFNTQSAWFILLILAINKYYAVTQFNDSMESDDG